jgi:hypothetical protein
MERGEKSFFTFFFLVKKCVKSPIQDSTLKNPLLKLLERQSLQVNGDAAKKNKKKKKKKKRKEKVLKRSPLHLT